jgi:hypothetical protein
MVKLAQGYPEGQGYLLYFSWIILILSALFTLFIAGRLYKNGILNLGHRLRFYQIIQWIITK